MAYKEIPLLGQLKAMAIRQVLTGYREVLTESAMGLTALEQVYYK